MSSKSYIDKISTSKDWEKYELVAIDKLKKDIEDYSNKGYDSIGFIWGDISIHPDLFEIIKESKSRWFKNINVITNAMIFSDYIKAKSLIESGVTRVNISIHSHNSTIEDHLTQIKWWFEKKLKAIDNFKELYSKWLLVSELSINIVLNGLNYKNIVETCLYFWKEKDINDIRINFIWPRFFTSQKDKEELMFTYTEFLPYLKKLIYISIKYNIRITFDSIPACIFYKVDSKNYKKIIKRFLWEDFDYIDEVSNINKDQVFYWKQQKKDQLKVKSDACLKCKYFNLCEWIWKEYVDDYWYKEFSAV